MPRAPRKQYAGALYHVTSRGNGRLTIFFDDRDRERFLEQLQDCLKNYGVVLYAYVLMSNHYHLLIRTRHPNLSRFMQRLNTSYALYSRYKHKKPGHRLEGRYKAKLVQGDDYIMTLTRYIHLNPVKVKALQRAGVAEQRQVLAGYRWSSYGGYVQERRKEEYVCYDILKTYEGNLTAAARRRYRVYVLACLMEDDVELRRMLERSGHGIGDEEYVGALERELRDRKSGSEKDRDVGYPEEPVIDGDIIDDVVAREYGVEGKALRSPGRRKGTEEAKAVAMDLVCRLGALTQREAGSRYGGVSSQAVSLARKRVRTLLSSEIIDRLVTNAKKESHGNP